MQPEAQEHGERNRQEKRLDATDEAYRQIVENEARQLHEKTERLRREREASAGKSRQPASP